LAYVGLTRARHRAYVSFAANRRIYGQWQNTIRSRFIEELPPEHVEIVAELGLQPAASWDAGWASTIEIPAAMPWRPRARPRHPLLASAGPVPRRGEEVHRVGGFVVGGRIFHQKFGYGTITGVEDNKLAIHFDVAGDKKVMDAFVEHA
ncbi:MAG: DNA helicase II, partial [Alphaproteobacteria bacterium]|nr:DNA helicase II [Alphaproteobacteria bacterium]